MNPFAALFATFVAVLSLTLPTPHIYPDAFVERSLSIVIRDQRGFGEYLIGLNNQTAERILKEARKKAGLKPVENVAKDLKIMESPASAGREKNEPPGKVSGEEHLTDPETVKALDALKKHWFEQSMEITIDGKSVPLVELKVEPAGRHPYSLKVSFQFDVQAKQIVAANDPSSRPVVSFQVKDDTFKELGGALRYALKARGDTMLQRSNVAPVLVRAKRLELSQVLNRERGKFTRIDAQLILPRQN